MTIGIQPIDTINDELAEALATLDLLTTLTDGTEEAQGNLDALKPNTLNTSFYAIRRRIHAAKEAADRWFKQEVSDRRPGTQKARTEEEVVHG